MSLRQAQADFWYNPSQPRPRIEDFGSVQICCRVEPVARNQRTAPTLQLLNQDIARISDYEEEENEDDRSGYAFTSFEVRRSMLNVRRSHSPKKHKSLPDLAVEQGQMGDGSAPSSLSRADIRRAPFGGCQLPDAILHGKRSLRPRGRAVQRLAAAGFRVRLFSLLD